MRVYAISDFHLSGTVDKPMDIFGSQWNGHWEKIRTNWLSSITDEDIVLSAGDTSWGMNLAQAVPDLLTLDELPGKKILIRGNHDYWWSSYAKLNSLGLDSVRFIQNNALEVGDYVVCGTRGWTVPEIGEGTSADKKIFDREVLRLKLTLEDGVSKLCDGKKLVLMMHYPPFDSRFSDSQFTELISKYPVDCVIYGHLHGNYSRFNAVVEKNGIKYFLTSCDYLSFKPLLIYE